MDGSGSALTPVTLLKILHSESNPDVGKSSLAAFQE